MLLLWSSRAKASRLKPLPQARSGLGGRTMAGAATLVAGGMLATALRGVAVRPRRAGGLALARLTLTAATLLRTRRAGIDAQRRGRLVAGHGGDRDVLLQQLADVEQQAAFVMADQRQRQAFHAGAAGAANAVHVILGHRRQVEVDHD